MPAVSTGPLPRAIGPELDVGTLLDRHEARQALLARVAYNLLRLTASVPSGVDLSVTAAATAAQRAMAWLSGSATNPGRWVDRPVLEAELAELDVLLAAAHGHLTAVLGWIRTSVRDNGPDRPTRVLRLPRSLASECEALVAKLSAEVTP